MVVTLYVKFHILFIKTKSHTGKSAHADHRISLWCQALQFLIKRQFSFQYHILQNHIHTNPYLEAHKPKINPSNVYAVNSNIDTMLFLPLQWTHIITIKQDMFRIQNMSSKLDPISFPLLSLIDTSFPPIQEQ